jgi:hypothetical protein
VLSGACGGSFDQSLVHALLGQEQAFSRAALHRLHSENDVILVAVEVVIMQCAQGRASST